MKRNAKVYIGACEYEVVMTKTKKESDKCLGKEEEINGTIWTTHGTCFLHEKRIVVRHTLKSRQDRYEVLLHEGIHAICHEFSESATLCTLCADEVAVAILSKSIASYLRQIRDNGVLDQ